MSKPVIVEGTASNSLAAGAPALVDQPAPAIAPLIPEELSPFPSDPLTSNVLPGLEPALPIRGSESAMQQTILSVETILEVESVNGELEKSTVSVPVFYPENMLSWNEESVAEAQTLAKKIETHLERVRQIQADSVLLIEDWNRLMDKSKPSSVLETGAALGQAE